jgi:hypothetical protein
MQFSQRRYTRREPMSGKVVHESRAPDVTSNIAVSHRAHQSTGGRVTRF